MKTEIKYIELKSGFNHNGPAWIGLVSFSKSGKTIYFDGKAFQRIGADRGNGNFYDIGTGEEYWISGVKKNQQDRHEYGNGKIYIEKRILSEYLETINKENINPKHYDIIEVNEEIPISKVYEIENQKLDNHSQMDDNKRFLEPSEMSDEELEYFIEYYHDNSINGRYLKGRKSSRRMMNKLLSEKESRKEKA